jgi:hypothetical protein
MSIYATLGTLRFPLDEMGTEWVEVCFQAVPSHIGHPSHYPDGDIYAEFLPPVRDPEVPEPEWDKHRAVVIIATDERKDGQRYVNPVLTLSGEEWETIPFPELWQRIEEALRQGRGLAE